MILEWKESFSVSNKDIDEQHKKLFEIGQRIYDSIASMSDYDRYDEIMEIFSELNEYVKYHFDFEEKLLEECGYSKLETQKMEHHFFVKKLEREAGKDIDAYQKESLIRLINFVADWIVQHILKEDMAYKDSLLMMKP